MRLTVHEVPDVGDAYHVGVAHGVVLSSSSEHDVSGNAQDTKNVAYPVWTGNATFVDIVGFCLWIDLSRDESERLSWFDGTIAAFNLSLADVLCPVWAYLPDF